MNIKEVSRQIGFCTNHDTLCPVCKESILGSLTVIVKDDKDIEHEIHHECFVGITRGKHAPVA